MQVVALVASTLLQKAMGNSAAAQARRAQQQQQKAEEAMQNRQAIAAQNEAERVDATAASQLRSVAAGRRGRGGLAFVGPQASLKSTLGG